MAPGRSRLPGFTGKLASGSLPGSGLRATNNLLPSATHICILQKTSQGV